jgi:hypothetical protein
LPRINDFNANLKEAEWRAKQASRLIDFSLRFEPNPKKPLKIGGVTMATAIVLDSRYYNVKCGERKLHAYWKNFEPVAGFLPLIAPNARLKRYIEVASRRPALKATMAERLIELIEDQKSLEQFFAEYNAHVARLAKRGYRLTSLSGIPAAEIEYEPLPEEVLEYANAY